MDKEDMQEADPLLKYSLGDLQDAASDAQDVLEAFLIKFTGALEERNSGSREDDASEILDMLLSHESDQGEESHFSVISIIGMAGLGKQLLLNSSSIILK
ncbi:hypothetical protein CK203_112943 [Vitis vinifera]|uniref:Uncharacterized protein n=1 Tax=Vitis vinifera TaxID=29760 RepID=A0A438CBH4_VITVI|nr:hypothetical protein CK203_112943 [Vitis vinifera]